MTSNGANRQSVNRNQKKARGVSPCHTSGHNRKSNLVQENPGTDRISLKLCLTFGKDGHTMLKAKSASEEWPRQLKFGLCLQSSSIPNTRPEQLWDRAMLGEFFGWRHKLKCQLLFYTGVQLLAYVTKVKICLQKQIKQTK